MIYYAAELAEKQANALGVIDGMDAELYHRSPGISNSGLTLFAKSPAHYKERPDKRTKAMKFGTICHAAVLEPDFFARRYAIEPKIDRRTKEGKATAAAFAAENEGKEIVSADDAAIIKGIAASVLRHPEARRIMEATIATEVSIFAAHEPTGLLLRSRIDIETEDEAADLKTSEDSWDWGRAVFNYRYHVQAPFYMDNLARVGREKRAFKFIVVEKTPPYAVVVHVLGEPSIQLGRETYERQLDYFRQCVEFDSWPSYATAIQTTDVPQWAFNKSE